jgi:hypothetical protein
MRYYAARWDGSAETGGRGYSGGPGTVYAFTSREERDEFATRRNAEALPRTSVHVKNANYLARVQNGEKPGQWTAVGICKVDYDMEEQDRKCNQPAA